MTAGMFSLALGIAALGAVTQPVAAAPETSKTPEETKMVEAFRSRCETLINDKNYTSKETPHYIVETDDPRFEVKEAAALLESFNTWFETYWSGRTELRPQEEKSFVFLFYSYYKYKQLLADAEMAGEIRPVGHYIGFFDVVAVHTDTVGAGDLPDVLVHEATHALVKTRIYGPDAEPSPWVGEGLASYFGFTHRDRSGSYQAGEIGGKEGVVFFPKASRSGARAGARTLEDFRRKVGKGEVGALGDLIAIDDPSDFYAGDPMEHYAMSWLLVHFLLHAGGGAHASGFATYLHHEAAGAAGAAAFYKDIGMEPAALEAAFREYVRDL